MANLALFSPTNLARPNKASSSKRSNEKNPNTLKSIIAKVLACINLFF
jgi:hypothetical protein